MYSFKNIKNMAKNNTGMMLILILCLFVSFGVLFFSIGIFYQYQKNIEDGEIDSYAVGFAINENVIKEDLCDFVESISPEMLENISYFTCLSSTYVSGLDDEAQTAFYVQYSDEKFEYASDVFDPMIDDLVIMNGSFFTQGEYSNGEAKAIVMGKGNEFQTTPAPDCTDTVEAFGKTYDVIGTINPGNSNYYFYSIYVPFESIPDDTELNDSVYFSFNKKITQSQYNSFTAKIVEYFGDKITLYDTDMDLESNYSYYITVSIISLGIAVLSALNISIVYNYIIISRQRQLNIMRLCGGVTSGLCLSTANEVMILMIPISVLSAVIYNAFILNLLSNKFPLIKSAYSVNIYAEIIVIYCALSYLLNLFLLHKNLKKYNWRL